MFHAFLLLVLTGAGLARADEAKSNDTKLIPLPIYATLPNEGGTYGFMPVFLVVDTKTQHTESIFAPSISWNSVIRYTGTFRWYHYPAPDTTFTLIPSFSSNINRNVTLEYAKLPTADGAISREGYFHFRRSVFYRFFGIGPNTKLGDQTSYTNLGGDLGGRVGYNLKGHFNVGLTAQLKRQLVEHKHVNFLPLSSDVFPGVPGMGGSAEAYEGGSLRYDSRPNREYSTDGAAAEFKAGFTEGLAGTGGYGTFEFDGRGLWQEIEERLYGGARVYWSYATGTNIPFYDQSTLGGSYRLRGFIENRFTDKGAWTAEVEQRFTLFQTHIYGVTADWRLDPFFEVGQVYQDFSDVAQNVKYAGGVGFRAYVRPNVLGRVDVAAGGEGLEVYVELGYPF